MISEQNVAINFHKSLNKCQVTKIVDICKCVLIISNKFKKKSESAHLVPMFDKGAVISAIVIDIIKKCFFNSS